MLVAPRGALSGQGAWAGAFLPCDSAFGPRKDMTTLTSVNELCGERWRPPRAGPASLGGSAAPLRAAPDLTRTFCDLSKQSPGFLVAPGGLLVNLSLLTS